MEEITLTLSLNQVNLILEALAQAPYKVVMELIPTIQQQAQAQVQANKLPAGGE